MNQVLRDAVRPIRADEWPKAKELRLLALKDPAAPIAFLETYEQAATEPDSFWQERAKGRPAGRGRGSSWLRAKTGPGAAQ